jgi:dTMP kinase
VGGAFISFEGVDGCGKTTQLRRLASRLAARCEVLTTREPGGTAAGARLRALLVEEGAPALAPDTELLLYAADRAQHVCEVLRPALAAGRVVLCDRYADATVAYQGHGRGLSLDLIAQLNRVATGGLAPDLTLLFDVDVGEAMRRLRLRSAAPAAEDPSRFDREARDFHQRVRDGYLEIAAAEPGRVRVVDASGPPEEVGARVDAAVAPVVESCRSRT